MVWVRVVSSFNQGKGRSSRRWGWVLIMILAGRRPCNPVPDAGAGMFPFAAGIGQVIFFFDNSMFI